MSSRDQTGQELPQPADPRVRTEAPNLPFGARLRDALRTISKRFASGDREHRRAVALADASFDAAGYDTRSLSTLLGLGTSTSRAAVSPDDFFRALDSLDLDYDGFTFVDLGSGKGRALLLAAREPFARIIGVELAQELHAVAISNLEYRTIQEGPDKRISAIHGEAANFVLPDAPTILFVHNPFAPPVLTRVIDNAERAWRQHGRPLRVVYLDPGHLDEWTGRGWTVLKHEPHLAILSPREG